MGWDKLGAAGKEEQPDLKERALEQGMQEGSCNPDLVFKDKSERERPRDIWVLIFGSVQWLRAGECLALLGKRLI